MKKLLSVFVIASFFGENLMAGGGHQPGPTQYFYPTLTPEQQEAQRLYSEAVQAQWLANRLARMRALGATGEFLHRTTIGYTNFFTFADHICRFPASEPERYADESTTCLRRVR